MHPPLHTTEIRILLEWYRAMGVDEAIDIAPASASHKLPNVAIPIVSASPKARTAPVFTGHSEALAESSRLAAAANTLEELHATVMGFTGCSLRNTATNTVFADGNASARVMVIGEAPGAEEDKRGIPFCGASGQLLDKMFAAIGLARHHDEAEQAFYITNTIFWRPPGNRQPTTAEIEICRPFVAKHIALVAPKLLVVAGATATGALLGETRPISRLRGQILSYEGAGITAPISTHVLYHPSFLLRQPIAKRQTWGDLLQLKEAIKSI